MSKRRVSKLHPNQFKVNEAWIAFKLNDAPIRTESDGDFNVIAVMDAASCFILGSELVPAKLAEPSNLQVRRLLMAGQAHQQPLPQTLFIPAEIAANTLAAAAGKHGIAVRRVSEQQLRAFIGEAQEGFKKHVGAD